MRRNTAVFPAIVKFLLGKSHRFRYTWEKTLRHLIDHGYIHFCSGGAKGFDLLAARTVLNLKAEFPALSLHMILPFRRQARHLEALRKF